MRLRGSDTTKRNRLAALLEFKKRCKPNQNRTIASAVLVMLYCFMNFAESLINPLNSLVPVATILAGRGGE